MPTNILYEVAATRYRGDDYYGESNESFLEIYNKFAIIAVRQRNRPTYDSHAVVRKSENNFYSQPSVWATDVISGIKRTIPNEKKQIIDIGKFLCDANLLGFSLKELTEGHIQEIANNRYLSVEQILQEDPNTTDVPKGILEEILNMSTVRHYLTKIPTGYGTNVMFVRKSLAYRLRQAVKRGLESRM